MMDWQQAKRDLRQGWKDAAWSWIFSLWLLPSIAGAMLVSCLLRGWGQSPGPEPDALDWLCMIPAAAFALWRACLWQEPDARYGPRGIVNQFREEDP